MNEISKTYNIYIIEEVGNGGYGKSEHKFTLFDDNHTSEASAIRWIENAGSVGDNYIIKAVYSIVPTYHF